MLETPIECDTPDKKLRFGYQSQTENIRIHNLMGKWSRPLLDSNSGGITQEEYDTLPDSIKNVIPFTVTILPQVEWLFFKKQIFELKNKVISLHLCECKKEINKMTIKPIGYIEATGDDMNDNPFTILKAEGLVSKDYIVNFDTIKREVKEVEVLEVK